MDNLIVEYKNAEIKLESELKIKDLNLKINKGEFVFLVGKTGSGKSSILKSMYS
jgi:cell division transport system ATP-binding protein